MARLQFAACVLVSGLVFCGGYSLEKRKIRIIGTDGDSSRTLQGGAKAGANGWNRTGTQGPSSLWWPGTKWCGAGDRARNYYDLGVHKEADACCRTHDYCPYFILQRSSKYGIFNKYHTTMSQCSCDIEFRDCLKRMESSTSRYVGWFFFKALTVRCFSFVDKAKTLAVLHVRPEW